MISELKNRFEKEYQKKLVSAQEAAAMIRSGECIAYGLGVSASNDVDAAIAARVSAGTLQGIELVNTLTVRPEPFAPIRAAASADQAKGVCAHFSGTDRKAAAAGKTWFLPMTFHELPRIWSEIRPVDTVLIQACPMNDYGVFNLGPSCGDLNGYLQSAKRVILEVNTQLPYCHGISTAITIDQVDAIVEGSNAPVNIVPNPKTGPEDEKIAEYVVDMIRSGSTLQLGIGSLPSAIGKLLCNSDLKNLHCHSEMLCEPFLDLYEAGKLTGLDQGPQKGRFVYAFAAGTRRLYDFLDHNPLCWQGPVDYVNAPYVIGSIDNFASVNGCIEVDLFGQVCSESAGTRHISGSGGQLDFVQGSFLSRGGRSILCLHSTRKNKDGSRSSLIRPTLSPGAIVTTPRSLVDTIVTEYGTAHLKGKSTWERAEALIGIAHPDFRDALIAEAEQMGIWCSTAKRI